ncbi:sugar ABC transporter substrate-binding protein [Actinoplanes sp. ATCC 53533]|uniref:sugar ABC transporter substrate-binding protein n=1 Tax=Actinoplanes sp. ATCC 53533 TaxID=1288362 RepID=UPI0018F4B9DA|nr:sugar ABC transporter substrate-binding protein [Actinoplanes sp. ATCC 53533]
MNPATCIMPPLTGRMSRRRFLAVSGGAATAAALAACSGPETAASGTGSSSAAAKALTKIGLDYPFSQLPSYAPLVKLTTAAAKQRNVELITTNDAAVFDTQVSSLTAWIGQRIPAIVSFPMVFEATEKIAKQALDAGLIWVTYGGSLQNQSADIQFSFLASGALLGDAAAQWATESLGGKGKIAFLTDATIQLGRDRTKGMIDAFTKAAPGVEVVAQEQAIDPDTGLSKVKAILAKHPDLNLVLGVTDAAAYGGFKALQQAGRADDDAKTFVGGVDGAIPSLLALKQGTFYRASVALSPRDIAEAIVNVPLAVAAGTPNPSADLPVTLLKKTDTAKIDDLIAQGS